MSTLTIVRLPTGYAGRFHPAVRELARRVRPEAVRLAAGGHVRRAAALAKAHGRFEDRHLVHLNDLEMAELARAWGPPHVNPDTGLPEYSFFSDIGGALSGLFGGISSGVGDVLSYLGPLGQLFNTGLGAYSAITGAGAPQGASPQANYGPSWYNPAGSTGAPTTLGAAPVAFGANLNDLLGLGGSLLGFVGALNRNKAQQKAYKQSQQAYQNFLGPHVDYHLGDNPTTVQGLTPTQPVETAGFRPEEQLTKSVNTTPMADGGLPRLPSMPPSWGRGALGRPLSASPPSLPWGPSRPPPSGEFPRGLAAAGQVGGDGGGQDDRVPAYLSQDEYVVPADVVSHVGDGSSNAGARRLDEFVRRIREHRGTADQLPPKMGPLMRYMDLMGSK